MSYDAAIALMKKGPAKPTLYSFNAGNRVSNETNDYLNIFCYTTEFPSARVNTVLAAGQEYMNSSREMPAGVIYTKPFTITIVENATWRTYLEMRQWLDATTSGANAEGLARVQRPRYYNTYTSQISLTKLEYEDTANRGDASTNELNSLYRPAMRFTFTNAWPTDVGGITVGSDMSDAPTFFDVSFTYESYYVESKLTDEDRLVRVPASIFG